MLVSLEALKAILRNAPVSKLAAYAPHLDDAMKQFSMVTRPRAAAFIAQLAHESGKFRWLQEIWGPTAQQKNAVHRARSLPAWPTSLRDRRMVIDASTTIHGLR